MSEMMRPAWAERTELERTYYDTEWGMPVTTEQGVYERLTLEVFQSGLSWTTILKRRDAFRAAFHNFDPAIVARFSPADIDRLLGDESIIRNRRKIIATVANALATVELRLDPSLHGGGAIEPGLPALVWSYRPDHHPIYPEPDIPTDIPESAALAKDLKSRGFLHVGPVSVYAMMQAIGVVNDHPENSPRRAAVDEAVRQTLGSR